MSFIQEREPDGKVAIKCCRCGDVEHFVRGDLRIPKHKREHRCPPTPEPREEAAA